MAFLLGRLTIIRVILAGMLIAMMIRVGYLSLYMGGMLAEKCVEAHLLCAELLYSGASSMIETVYVSQIRVNRFMRLFSRLI